MKKTAVVYWSGTGNTKAMAEAVLAGMEGAGADARLYEANEFNKELAGECDAVAFGCPAMGGEELEDSEFAPVYETCKPELSGKEAALFGSYGWGGGEWMRSWEEDARAAGMKLVCDSVICCGAPEADAESACRALGEALARL